MPNSNSNINHSNFALHLLEWFEQHGRHDLPWQQHKTDTPDAYQVWLSEVMLQQTQVTTVIPYFLRFMQSFPTVQALANAEWDTVAEHWAGLGYYARARNLHKGAKQLVDIIEQTGHFPQTVDEWEQISGVGRSTAGAIVAMGLHGYGVICDGNVKRVLTRWAGIDDDITKAATTKKLWALATNLTPQTNSGEFAQAMMDMGATLCKRTKPACLTSSSCPLQNDCTAFAQNKQTAYPVKAKKKPKPSKHSQALFIKDENGNVLWLKRPDNGIWGGLWCLPLHFNQKTQGKKVLQTKADNTVYDKEYTTAEQIIDAFLAKNTNTTMDAQISNEPIKHTLTHFHWYLTAQHATLDSKHVANLNKLLDDAMITKNWVSINEALNTLALPKAMLKLIDGIVTVSDA